MPSRRPNPPTNPVPERDRMISHLANMLPSEVNEFESIQRRIVNQALARGISRDAVTNDDLLRATRMLRRMLAAGRRSHANWVWRKRSGEVELLSVVEMAEEELLRRRTEGWDHELSELEKQVEHIANPRLKEEEEAKRRRRSEAAKRRWEAGRAKQREDR